MSLFGRYLISRPNVFFCESSTLLGAGGTALGIFLTLNPLTTPLGVVVGAPATMVLCAGVLDYLAINIALEMDDDLYLKNKLPGVSQKKLKPRSELEEASSASMDEDKQVTEMVFA